MQDVLIVSYLVSKEFDLLSRSIFDHSDDCCEDCAGNATADGLTCVIPDLSCALPLRCPNNELDRGPMTRNALSALSPKADMCSARGYVRFGLQTYATHVRFTPESDAECVHSNVR